MKSTRGYSRRRILFIKPFAVINNPDWDDYQLYTGQNNYGAAPYGEGIVLKNYAFVNKFGHRIYGKLVAKDFQEVLPSEPVTITQVAIEDQIAKRYVTPARVRKLVEKHEFCEMSDIPKLFGLVYYDVVTEDAWDILKRFKNPAINFKQLEQSIRTAAKAHYVELLQEKVRAA